MHTEPDAHRTPQPPQFWESVRTSRHWVERKPQHWPTAMLWVRHALPWKPELQLVGTHWLPRQKVPFWQLRHVVLGAGGRQTSWLKMEVPSQRPLHGVPQVPQLALSWFTSTQRPWQHVPFGGVFPVATPKAHAPPDAPGWHEGDWHRLLTQSLPAAQGSPPVE